MADDWEDAPDSGWEDAPETSGKTYFKKIGKQAVGVGEAAASMVAGIPSQIAGGLAGFGALLAGRGLDDAANRVEQVQKNNFGFGAYSPSTDKGKEYSQNAQAVFTAPGEYAGKLGGYIGKQLGNEALGELSLKLPVDTAMNFLPLKVPHAVKGAFERVGRPGEKKFGKELEVSKDATLWEDAPTKEAPIFDSSNAGYNAFDKILESQIAGEQSPMRGFADPMEQIKQQLDSQRQTEVQRILDARQKQMELDVAKQQGLDFNAAERQRQLNAPTGAAEHTFEQGRQEFQQAYAEMQKAQQEAAAAQEAANSARTAQEAMQAQERQAAAQEALTRRQAELEASVKRQQQLDFNAAERARQEQAPTHFADWQLDRAVDEAKQTHDFVSNAHQMEIDATPYGDVPAQFGSTLEHGRIDENGMPIRADLSIEAQNLQDPLQRNLWGDELPGRTGDNSLPLTRALDKLPNGEARDLAMSQLTGGSHWGRSSVVSKDFWANKQRGAVDLGSIGESLRKVYSSFEKQIEALGKVAIPKTLTLDDQARNIPGMGNLDGMFVRPKAAKDILPTILKEGDGPALWKGIQQGLSATAEKVNSSLMRYTSDWLNYVDKKTEFDYKKMVRPTQDKLIALPVKDKVALSKVLLNEMFNKKRFTPEEMQGMGFNQKQLEAYKALRDNLDMIADRYDASRALLGKEPIDRGQAYLASTRQGNYHVVITNGEGRPLWHVAEHSKRDAYKFINWAKENLKDVPGINLADLDKHLQEGVLPGTVKSDTMYRKSNKFYNIPRDVLGAHMELAKLIEGNDPSVSAIREAIQAAAEKAGYDVTSTKQRFMEKANVRGFNGDKPWLSAEENAVSLLNSQLQTIKEGLNWSYHQDMIAQLKEVLSNPELQAAQPNNIGMVNNVLGHQLGLTKSIFKDAEDWVAHNMFGADRAGLKQVVQDMKTFTYLQQLGVSAGYVIATPLQALNSVGVAMRERGLGALSPITATKALADGATAILNDISLELAGKSSAPMTKIGKLALQYAEDNGIVNKLVFNAGHEMPRVDNAPGNFRKAYSATMSLPEKVSRIMPFMAFVHHLNDMGTYKTPMEIFKRAEELTEFTQINFRSSEKPTLVKDLGSIGDLAYVYKGPIFNYFNQLSTFSRNAYKGVERSRNVAALGALVGVTAYLGGALSLPLLNEMDGAYNVYKNAMANWSPDKYKSDLGIKGNIISKLDKSVAYGAISDITGAQMSSRFTPNTVDVEKPLSGMAPVAAEVAEQESILHFLHSPSKKTFMQGVYNNAPPAVRGLMENNISEFQGPKRADGSQVVLTPSNIGAQKAMITRTPEQQSYRNLGLRELGEARKVDLNKINDAEQRRVQTAFEGTADKMFHAMTQEKDPQAIRKYGSKMLELMPDSRMFNATLSKKINEWGTTPEERMQIKSNMIQNLMKIKRLQDAAK